VTRTDRETLVRMIAEWRQGKKGLIEEEMLKAAVKPLIDVEVNHYARQGIRREDLEQEAWNILLIALQDYDPSIRNVTGFLADRLAGLEDRLEHLRAVAARLRNSDVPQGIRT
jgi:DNA-directed RNA polymerase specialized sigma subunit